MRKNKKQRFTYDKLGRLIFCEINNLSLTYEYVYCDNLNFNSNRTCIIKNEDNSSNFKTIIIQQFINNKYINSKKEELGEVYKTTVEYNDRGEEIKMERINKIKNTFYSKVYIRDKFGKPIIWLEKYNKEKNIGFRIKKDLIF